MKSATPFIIVLPLVLCAGAALAGPAAAGHDHASHEQASYEQASHEQAPDTAHATHATHAAPLAAQVPADRVRWRPDAPLREGMRRMRTAVDALAHGEHGHLDPVQVQRLATDVEGAAAYMFEHCTLAPEPDAALHGILARLIGGARALDADPADTTPVAAMRGAVADYPRLFDDPDFDTTGK